MLTVGAHTGHIHGYTGFCPWGVGGKCPRVGHVGYAGGPLGGVCNLGSRTYSRLLRTLCRFPFLHPPSLPREFSHAGVLRVLGGMTQIGVAWEVPAGLGGKAITCGQGTSLGTELRCFWGRGDVGDVKLTLLPCPLQHIPSQCCSFPQQGARTSKQL